MNWEERVALCVDAAFFEEGAVFAGGAGVDVDMEGRGHRNVPKIQ